MGLYLIVLQLLGLVEEVVLLSHCFLYFWIILPIPTDQAESVVVSLSQSPQDFFDVDLLPLHPVFVRFELLLVEGFLGFGLSRNS